MSLFQYRVVSDCSRVISVRIIYMMICFCFMTPYAEGTQGISKFQRMNRHFPLTSHLSGSEEGERGKKRDKQFFIRV